MARCPRRLGNVLYFLLQMIQSQVHPAFVHHEAAVAKVELRYHLLVVRQGLKYVLPGDVNIMEDLVRRAADGLVLDLQYLTWKLSY